MRFSTSAGLLETSQVLDALNFACYAYNRNQGMTAEQLARLFPDSGARMEQRYQENKREAA